MIYLWLICEVEIISGVVECCNIEYDKKPTKILENISVENACHGNQVGK